MIRQYYKLDIDQSKSLLDEFHATTEPLVKERSDLILDFKKEFKVEGDMVVEQLPMGTYQAVGYEVVGNTPSPEWAKPSHFPLNDGRQHYLTPKRNWAMGKRFQWWLDKINGVEIPSFSSSAIDAVLGGQKTMIHDMAMHYTVAGYHDDVVVFSVPTKDDTLVDITKPFNVVQIKKSEYVALTEES